MVCTLTYIPLISDFVMYTPWADPEGGAQGPPHPHEDSQVAIGFHRNNTRNKHYYLELHFMLQRLFHNSTCFFAEAISPSPTCLINSIIHELS